MQTRRSKIKRPGYILLEGGAEFGGKMALADRRALHIAGGGKARVAIIPAAAAPDANHTRAGSNGIRWFQRLGAGHVEAVPLVDSASANRPDIANVLESSSLIYLLGGFPEHLAHSLSGTLSWRAVKKAYQGGAVIAGSSAGAMVLCDHFYDPAAQQVRNGLSLLNGVCILPHHNRIAGSWLARLQTDLPEAAFVGIDERTGMIDDAVARRWTVYGSGQITLYRSDGVRRYGPGETFSLTGDC